MAGANNDFPILDGIAPSWADVVLKITPAGASLITVRDVKSISSGSTVEVGTQLAGGRPKDVTTGQLGHEGSFTLYLSGAQQFERALMNAAVSANLTRQGIAQISLVRFQIDYLFTPPGAVEIIERRLKGCRLLSDSEAPAEGTDATTVDYTIFIPERVKVIDGVEVALL